MRTGVIGAGSIGATLTGRFVAEGHVVLLANSRGPDTLKEKAGEIAATAVSVGHALNGVDVVVVSIPEGRIPRLPKDLFTALPADVPVVDTGNYFPGLLDEPIAAIEAGMPESQWVAEQLGHPVIKAFNSIMASSLAGKGHKPGDDAEAKRRIIGLVNDAGFDGIDAGSRADSWRQQPGTPAYCTNLDAGALRHALATADKGDAPHKRDLALQRRCEAGQQTGDEVLQLYRSLFARSERTA